MAVQGERPSISQLPMAAPVAWAVRQIVERPPVVAMVPSLLARFTAMSRVEVHRVKHRSMAAPVALPPRVPRTVVIRPVALPRAVLVLAVPHTLEIRRAVIPPVEIIRVATAVVEPVARVLAEPEPEALAV